MSERAIRYNEAQGYPRETVRRLQRELGVDDDGVWGPITCGALADWQRALGLVADGMAGPAVRGALAEVWGEERELTRCEILKLARPTIRHESGGRLDAANRDFEYEGRFDEPGDLHWASKHNPGGGTHVGLSLGPIQVTQDGGNLGRWLAELWEADAQLVERHLGERAADVVELTNRRGREREAVSGQGPGQRSPRVRQIDGADLWEPPWVDRLRALARTEEGAQAFETVAVDVYMRPQLELADELGMHGQGALAVVFDIAIQFGGGGCRRRMRAGARGGQLTVGDLIDELPPKHHPRRWRVYCRSEWWVTYRSPL